VDAERFISMVKRDTFDYTEWQKKLWDGLSIEELHSMGVMLEKSNAVSQ
jgi:CTP:phosphocholine cytidylyltransferase-like protein